MPHMYTVTKRVRQHTHDVHIKTYKKGASVLDAPSYYRWKPLVSMAFFLPDRIIEYSF